jgi:hypothetical protein
LIVIECIFLIPASKKPGRLPHDYSLILRALPLAKIFTLELLTHYLGQILREVLFHKVTMGIFYIVHLLLVHAEASFVIVDVILLI